MITNEQMLKIYIIASVFFSIMAFLHYALDKMKAMKGAPRIPEKILLFLAAFLGSVGAIVGRIVFRHKTNKLYFSIVAYFSLAIQIITLILLINLK